MTPDAGLAIDVQLNPATTPWPRLRDAALAAEEAGFGAIWAWDHLAGSLLGGTTMLECFTLLGALAAATTTVGLGSLVANVGTRHPGVLASAAASVQTISAGRLLLGVGAGASPTSPASAEQHALGLVVPATLAERHARLSYTLDVVAELWAHPRHSRYAGFARPDPRPPILLGVNSRRLAEIAGRRADGINVSAAHPDLAGVLRAGSVAHDGRPGTWTASVWAPWDTALADPEHPQRRRFRELGVSRLVLVCLEPADPELLRAAAPFLR